MRMAGLCQFYWRTCFDFVCDWKLFRTMDWTQRSTTCDQLTTLLLLLLLLLLLKRQSPELLIRRSRDLRTEFGRRKKWRKALRGWSAITPKQIQHGWQPPSWNLLWRHISAVGVPIWTKFGSVMQNNMQITAKWSRSKVEVEFNMADVCFYKPEVVISQPWIEICRRNLACW